MAHQKTTEKYLKAAQAEFAQRSRQVDAPRPSSSGALNLDEDDSKASLTAAVNPAHVMQALCKQYVSDTKGCSGISSLWGAKRHHTGFCRRLASLPDDVKITPEPDEDKDVSQAFADEELAVRAFINEINLYVANKDGTPRTIEPSGDFAHLLGVFTCVYPRYFNLFDTRIQQMLLDQELFNKHNTIFRSELDEIAKKLLADLEKKSKQPKAICELLINCYPLLGSEVKSAINERFAKIASFTNDPVMRTLCCPLSTIRAVKKAQKEIFKLNAFSSSNKLLAEMKRPPNKPERPAEIVEELTSRYPLLSQPERETIDSTLQKMVINGKWELKTNDVKRGHKVVLQQEFRDMKHGANIKNLLEELETNPENTEAVCDKIVAQFSLLDESQQSSALRALESISLTDSFEKQKSDVIQQESKDVKKDLQRTHAHAAIIQQTIESIRTTQTEATERARISSRPTLESRQLAAQNYPALITIIAQLATQLKDLLQKNVAEIVNRLTTVSQDNPLRAYRPTIAECGVREKAIRDLAKQKQAEAVLSQPRPRMSPHTSNGRKVTN